MKTVIATTAAPGAIGPYSQAIEANGFVFVSGQIPLDPAPAMWSRPPFSSPTWVRSPR